MKNEIRLVSSRFGVAVTKKQWNYLDSIDYYKKLSLLGCYDIDLGSCTLFFSAETEDVKNAKKAVRKLLKDR